ncbi:response regulator transcription factor [Streptomyces sp. NPDC016309]|uniref:helix-turn-helix transcriptional regulator n=1 Tax=Streptomyces sp. NPDC016309 TaxID=3364965 RepID=UPI00370037A0
MSERVEEAVDVRGALLRLRRTTGVHTAFGGLLLDGRRLRIAEQTGAVTGALPGLVIGAGSGLGGKAIALARPCAVTDYPVARHISHEYDGPVAAEGLRSVLAVPVVVRRRVRGVLYGALREASPLGGRVFDAAVAAARDVEQALAVRDEARRLPAAGAGGGPAGRAPAGAAPDGEGRGAWEAVREAHGELRALAPRIADPALRAELLAVCGRIAAAQAGPGAPVVSLAPREVDVLGAVASGATNAGAAELLGLRPETVKGYLRSAMRKLGAHTRGQAVVAARRAGLLP